MYRNTRMHMPTPSFSVNKKRANGKFFILLKAVGAENRRCFSVYCFLGCERSTPPAWLDTVGELI